jgi:hypothetical protein
MAIEVRRRERRERAWATSMASVYPLGGTQVVCLARVYFCRSDK